MRRQLNLNRYYEGLELEAVNELFSRMLDMKPNVDGLDYTYHKSKDRFDQPQNWLYARALGQSGVRYQARKIDRILLDRDKEPAFGIAMSNDPPLTTEDYEAIIERYRYLMSEPEAGKAE